MFQIFVTNTSKQIIYENIGVGRIKTFLDKRGVNTQITYLYQGEGIEEELKKVDFTKKYYGFSFLYCYSGFIFELCRRIKEKNPDCVIFLGGRSVTDAYKMIFEESKYFDCVTLGHGENPLLYAITELEKGKTIEEIAKVHKNIATRECCEGKEECYEDINNLELPDRDVIKGKLTTACICTSHGCVGHCTFCSWKSTGAKWNGRPMKSVFDEIVSIYSDTGIKDFTFNDGSFEDPGKLGKKRINELCSYLEEYPEKFAFRFYMRAESFHDVEEDMELLRRMRRNGFVTAFVGVESGSQHDLDVYEKRATVEDNERVFELLDKADIDMLYGFIMMNPYSTLTSLYENYSFLCRKKCYHLFSFVNTLDVFYNTGIYDRVKADKLLLPDYSYNRTSEYVNKYEETEAIKAFLNDNFNDDKQIMRDYWEFYNFMNYFQFVKIQYIDIYNQYKPEIDRITDFISKCCEKYFRYLFVDNDLQTCNDALGGFIDEMEGYYKQIRTHKYRVMRTVAKCEKV